MVCSGTSQYSVTIVTGLEINFQDILFQICMKMMQFDLNNVLSIVKCQGFSKSTRHTCSPLWVRSQWSHHKRVTAMDVQFNTFLYLKFNLARSRNLARFTTSISHSREIPKTRNLVNCKYNFTKFHQNRMKYKKVLVIARLTNESSVKP